jgi:hypothetical protein
VEPELIANEVFGRRMFLRANMNDIIVDAKAISTEEEIFYLLVWDFQANREMNEQARETGSFLFRGEEEGK